MTYIDDLYAERYSRSSWWITPKPAPVDHDLAAAKRRRDAEDEARRVEREAS